MILIMMIWLKRLNDYYKNQINILKNKFYILINKYKYFKYDYNKEKLIKFRKIDYNN